MTAYLIDTNVLSELVRPRPDPRVAAFLKGQPDLWLSVVTLHELNFGAECAKDPARKAQLIAWIESIRHEFAGRLLPIDDGQAMLGGRLRALAISLGRSDDALDAMIASAAASRGLTIATRNTRDFEGFGVALFNPWDEPATR